MRLYSRGQPFRMLLVRHRMHSADGLPAAGEHGALEGQEPRAACLYGAAAGTVKAALKVEALARVLGGPRF